MKEFIGNIKITFKGLGYVSPDPNAPSIEIDPHSLNTALPGDKVRVRLLPQAPNEPLTGLPAQAGEVVEVLERKRLEFVGTIEQDGEFFYLVPDEGRVYKDFLIKGGLHGGNAGDKALARLTEWPDPKKDPIVEIVSILGPAGQHTVEIQAILHEKGFKSEFPPEVEQASAEIK
jgi:ribonuclease R/exosome complex exonuclease DIS3/RRP44